MKPYHLTPEASQNNAFTAHLSGEPSVFTNGKGKTAAQHGQDLRNLTRTTPKAPGQKITFAKGVRK